MPNYLVTIRITNCDGLCTDGIAKDATFRIGAHMNAQTPTEAEQLTIEKCCIDLKDYDGPANGRFKYECISVALTEKVMPGQKKVTVEELKKADRTARHIRPPGSKAERAKPKKQRGPGIND